MSSIHAPEKPQAPQVLSVCCMRWATDVRGSVAPYHSMCYATTLLEVVLRKFYRLREEFLI